MGDGQPSTVTPYSTRTTRRRPRRACSGSTSVGCRPGRGRTGWRWPVGAAGSVHRGAARRGCEPDGVV